MEQSSGFAQTSRETWVLSRIVRQCFESFKEQERYFNVHCPTRIFPEISRLGDTQFFLIQADCVEVLHLLKN